jgi:polyisoprenoid-binding protein YceI
MSKTWRLLQAVILAASTFTGPGAMPVQSLAASYTFDSRRADVRFTYYAGFVAQSGHFTQLNGIFQFDPSAPQTGSIDAVIKTASLTASAWESELKGSDFFNIAAFPEIRFQSHSAKPTGMDSAEFTGDLTMKGVTQAATLKASLAGGRHVSAKMRISRSAFNMTALGFLVADDIDIQIEADLLEK